MKIEAKKHDQIDSLVNIVYTFSDDIGMAFEIKKCGVLVLKQGKVDKAKLVEKVNEQPIRANCIKYHIDKIVDSPSCRMCGDTGETISHTWI